MPDCKAILLDGGFSASPYVEKRIKEAFGDLVPAILRPPLPAAAICEGAVIFGLNPAIMLSRVARKTYGISIAAPFDHRQHPPGHRFISSGGVAYCRNIFCKFVENGSDDDVDEEVVHEFEALWNGQTKIDVVIHSTDDEWPKFTTDPGVQLEGLFSLDLQQDTFAHCKTIDVIMHFGRASIEVCARTAS